MSWKHSKEFTDLLSHNPSFFYVFLEEGLKFFSSLYFFLISVRATKYVFGSPIQIGKKMEGSTHPFFQAFTKNSTVDSYINSLCRSP